MASMMSLKYVEGPPEEAPAEPLKICPTVSAEALYVTALSGRAIFTGTSTPGD